MNEVTQIEPKLEKAKRKQMAISALHGAGIPLAEIARVCGLQRESVSYVIERQLPNRDDLQDIYRAFREEVKPLVRSLLTKAFAQLDQKLTIKSRSTSIRDLVAVIRDVGHIAGFYEEVQPNSTTKLTQRIDTANPEVVQALMTALSDESKAREKTIQAVAEEPSG